MSKKFKEDDIVIAKPGYANLNTEDRFNNKPHNVERVEDVDLSYEKQFVYVKHHGKEQGYYASALQLAPPETT